MDVTDAKSSLRVPRECRKAPRNSATQSIPNQQSIYPFPTFVPTTLDCCPCPATHYSSSDRRKVYLVGPEGLTTIWSQAAPAGPMSICTINAHTVQNRQYPYLYNPQHYKSIKSRSRAYTTTYTYTTYPSKPALPKGAACDLWWITPPARESREDRQQVIRENPGPKVVTTTESPPRHNAAI